MKKLITLLILLTLGIGFNTLQAVVAVRPAANETAMSPKEIRKAKDQEKKSKKFEKILEKVQKKISRIAKKKKGAKAGSGLSSLDKNLRLAIIFGILAVAASILAALITSALWWLVTPLWIVGFVFLILWLINDV